MAGKVKKLFEYLVVRDQLKAQTRKLVGDLSSTERVRVVSGKDGLIRSRN